MKGRFDHVQYGAANETLQFYRDLAAFFEMQTLMDSPNFMGIGDGNSSFWVGGVADDKKAHVYDRDAAGLNHIGIKVSSAEEVQTFQRDFMQPRGIEPQFDTPRARTDFGPSYYQVMFVDPEGLAIEVFCS